MVDPDIPQAHAWLSRWRFLLARNGLRLLAVELIVTLAGAIVVLPWLLSRLISDMTAAVVEVALSAIPGSLLTAWAWSAALVIMAQDPSDGSSRVTLGAALRAGLRGDGLRGVLRLGAWLMVFQVFSLPSLLIYFDLDLAIAYMRSPISTLLLGLSWYVAFATALLPMVIMIERRGIARAWLLAHSKLSTVVSIGVVLALGFVAEQLLDELPTGIVATLSTITIDILLAVMATVAYYVIYLARVDERRDETIGVNV